jgi:hypothetical protein
LKSRNITHHPNYDGDQFSTVEDEIENLREAVAAVLPAPGMVDAGVFYDASESAYRLFTPTAPLVFSEENLTVSVATDTAPGVVEHATDAEIMAAASGNLVIKSSHLSTAAAFVPITDGGSPSFDWSAGINRSWAASSDRVIPNPTNVQPGTWRTMLVSSTSGTNRTFTFDTHYGGDKPPVVVSDTNTMLLTFFAVSTSHILVSGMRANAP